MTVNIETQGVRGLWNTSTGPVNVWKQIVKAHCIGLSFKVGTALQCEDEIVTEAGIRQEGKAIRAEERNRLKLSYRPLQELDNRRLVSTLTGILGNKGLKEWRYGIGKADSPECRWCGMAPENFTHITTNCKPWKDKLPKGADGLRQPKGGGAEKHQNKRLRFLGLPNSDQQAPKDSLGRPNHEGAAQMVREAWEARVAKGDLDVAVMWVKDHRGRPCNTGHSED
ncbi:hypothetical protein BDZ91DRAFT_791271 [Kalaharituber pfeilii]|nr:hypothetical protein BDZ91DRAFT_791271 [Kalaharituber pfeilii]